MLIKNSNIILVGFMGSGKTYWGMRLSQILNLNIVDTDRLIEKCEGKPIPSIFEEHGETYFRELERESIKKIQSNSRLIISTGGGMPCFNDNMSLLNTKGLTIYLKCKVETLTNRLMKEKLDRPLIKDKSELELSEYIQNLLNERDFFYRQSNIIIEEEYQNLDQIINHIKNARIS